MKKDFELQEILDIPSLIKKYSDKGIFIEILADGYIFEDVGICWRANIIWKENEKWLNDDCGCFLEWIDAFKSSIKYINDHLQDLL